MSDTNLTLVLIAVIALVGTISTVIGSIIVANMSKKMSEIHVMVNSNLDAARQERATAIQALARLNEQHSETVAAAVSKGISEFVRQERLSGRV
jgi:F0F1-type ATP synthase membrane subunit b/b'